MRKTKNDIQTEKMAIDFFLCHLTNGGTFTFINKENTKNPMVKHFTKANFDINSNVLTVEMDDTTETYEFTDRFNSCAFSDDKILRLCVYRLDDNSDALLFEANK